MVDVAAYTDQASDSALVAQTRQGDSAAFAGLVRRYERPLYAYARRMLGSADEAEDVFQETFLRVHLHLDRFRDGEPFRPWLYQIATNVCRDRLRWWRRRPRVSLDAPLGSGHDGPTYAELAVSLDAGPYGRACESELAIRLEAAVAGLPVKQRAVFLMSRYEGMCYEDISIALKIPVGTVKSRMSKAVQRLLAAIEGTD